MAHLNKLAIRGIRSFDDKQISVIEFFTPVTVIVGHNGSGKTTIIECLKYATTGDQPPNTRGGAFIHDPKMANEKEVKAQVKLRFHAANGTRMLAVRNLSVSQKKGGGLTMKTLENILAVDNGNEKAGKRGVLSTKCAELDAEIPNLLGVSKAVLENVIFCHQEDSYWPLSEPSTLKKKFDDIFEATKYTKALDNIKGIRKERTADLKAEKERLEGLQREKAIADKLKGRIVDANSSLSTKEVEYNATVADHEQLVHKNSKFYELSHKFREVYQKVESLEKERERYKKERASAEDSMQEIPGTDEELQDRLDNFEQHRQQQRLKLRQEDNKRQDVEQELNDQRKAHMTLVAEIGELRGEEKAQEARIQDREALIRGISANQGIKGFDHSPLDRDHVTRFMDRITDLMRRQHDETANLQTEIRTKEDEFNTKSRQLSSRLEGLKQQKTSLREEITKLQSAIAESERKVDATQSLPGELRALAADMEDKSARLEKLRADLRTAAYEERAAEKQAAGRALEDRRDSLSAELRTLSLQADSRARLDIKRTELRNKKAETENILSTNKPKFKKFVGTDAKADTMERELERVSTDKERELSEAERQASAANLALQQAEASISQINKQLKLKQAELKTLDRTLKTELEGATVAAALKDAQEEVNHRKEALGVSSGARQVYEHLLKIGRRDKNCPTCSRHMEKADIEVFEELLQDRISSASTEGQKKMAVELEDWQSEVARIQSFQSVEASRNNLKNEEIPKLEAQSKEHEAAHPALVKKAEEAQSQLDKLKGEVREVATMKQAAVAITRLLKDTDRLAQETAGLEDALSATGSTKTADDVQLELDTIGGELRTIDTEKRMLAQERERQLQGISSHEKDLHAMQLNESKLRNDLREREHLEERIGHYKKEIASCSAKSKDVDTKLAEAQAPIDQLEEEHRTAKSQLETQFSQAQELAQSITRDHDKLEGDNRAIEKYVRDRRGRRLKECTERSEALETELAQLTSTLEKAREAVSEIEREISEGAATVANLRENLRVRKLQAMIEATQAEIETYDLGAAAKAKANFEQQYSVEKQKETNLHAKFSSLAGELSSEKARLKELEKDLREYKDVQKKYTEQLIKVKMSDMANNDLEKYAKALDNAIMKYHSLKMEEVNDIMRHLWNKTYQGTDIDGIKIRYDAEGGASKRSYNYRVVMTKDQVEMDMRGRCSAGQKMLASIIIRLALSDSFGQNCGILALDEPTNALDVENIDALASALIEVINARKGNGNFQLIIITHDENFLAKLGQSEVMDHYWRVSRDARQKSVIERQRFR